MAGRNRGREIWILGCLLHYGGNGLKPHLDLFYTLKGSDRDICLRSFMSGPGLPESNEVWRNIKCFFSSSDSANTLLWRWGWARPGTVSWLGGVCWHVASFSHCCTLYPSGRSRWTFAREACYPVFTLEEQNRTLPHLLRTIPCQPGADPIAQQLILAAHWLHPVNSIQTNSHLKGRRQSTLM